MTIEEYEKHLVGELCWSCHEATHKCSSRQRQCPRCRKKICYLRSQRQWSLLKAFVLQASANSAAKNIGVSYPTAHAAFRRFRETLAGLAATEAGQLMGEIEVDESKLKIIRSEIPSLWSDLASVVTIEPAKTAVTVSL